MDDRIALGRIGRAHGIHGAFRLWPYADDLDRFQLLEEVTLTRGEQSLTVRIRRVRTARGHLVVETEQLRNPDDVRPWVGGDLEIEADQRIQLPPGQYFHDQIIGLQVKTTGGETIGTITRVMDGPANDVYVCRQDDHEHLIPAVEQFVKSIDLDAGVMTIEPIDGLLNLQ